MPVAPDFDAPSRIGDKIDIVVNEKGASAVIRALNLLADSTQKLSPAAARSLRAQALRLGLNLNKLVQDVAIEILTTVVHTSPVDTGQFRGGWTTDIRVSNTRSEPLYGNLDKSGDATIAKGKATITSSPRPDGHSVIISNALPYGRALNEGWSKQAPAGFVQMAVQAGNQIARNARILK